MKASFVTLVLTISWPAMAFATDTTVQEGRSVGKACSPSAVVCAISKDGSMKKIDECGARGDRTSRILSGACFDPD